MPNPKLTELQYDAARILYEAGKTRNEIAEVLKVSYSSATKMVGDAGFHVPSTSEKVLIEPFTEEIRVAYLNGESVSTIQKRYGVRHNAIYKLLRENGVAIRSKSEAAKNRYTIKTKKRK